MQKAIDKIKNAKSIAIFPHINEDFDAIGSCLAFAAVLRNSGKEAVCYVSEELDSDFDFVGGDYVVYDTEKVYSHDLALCLDCGDKDRLGARQKLFDEIGNSVNIDHHCTNTNFADVNYVDAEASATGEILAELFKVMGAEVNDETARYLYIAISSDTGCFKYSNVTPKTMRIAADLLEFDFDHAEAARLLFDTYTLPFLKLRAEITQNIHSHADGKIKSVCVDEELVKKYGLEIKEVSNIVDIPRCVQGTEIAVCIKRQNGGIRVSLRSNGEANVAAAAEKFGGGGHVKAAGCSVEADTLEAAEKLIIEECVKAL